MKKLFITLTALCAMSMGAWAESSQREGAMNLEGILLWKMPAGGGTMTIYGDDYQPMMNYSSADDNLRQFAGPEVESIDMQKGFNIGNYAFSQLDGLESVTLHRSSTFPIYCIGESAFAGSSKLASFNSKDLDDLRYIGANAFAGTAIKTFTINKPMGRELAYYAMQANGFSIDLNLEHCYIGASAFADCPYLSTVYMKDDTPFADTYNNFLNDYAYLVVNSAEAAATYRAAWTEIADRIIYLQENITFENEADAFAGRNMVSVYIPEGVKEIGTNAFRRCRRLLSLHLPQSVEKIGAYSFEMLGEMRSLRLSGNIKEIPHNAFVCCDSLKILEIPEGVEVLGLDCFAMNKSLEEVVLPSTITTISRGVFWNSRKLKKVVIPASVTTIGEYVFFDCKQLTDVYNYAPVPQPLSPIFNKRGITLHVPRGSEELYRQADNWNVAKVVGDL